MCREIQSLSEKVMKHRPMLAVVLCRSHTRSMALGLPLGPSRPFSSWERIISYGVLSEMGELSERQRERERERVSEDRPTNFWSH